MELAEKPTFKHFLAGHPSSPCAHMGQTKLGCFPLLVAEVERLKNWLALPEQFLAV
jgi:hypothetical protein